MVKKLVVSILGLFLMGGLLSACGGDDGESEAIPLEEIPVEKREGTNPRDRDKSSDDEENVDDDPESPPSTDEESETPVTPPSTAPIDEYTPGEVVIGEPGEITTDDPDAPVPDEPIDDSTPVTPPGEELEPTYDGWVNCVTDLQEEMGLVGNDLTPVDIGKEKEYADGVAACDEQWGAPSPD